jgi:hypothetical protein
MAIGPTLRSLIDNTCVTDTKYVITRPDATSGLGANLLSMVAALYLCEQTGRALIVDWTGMAPLRDKQVNYFVAFFEPIRQWRSVNVFYVNDCDEHRRPLDYDVNDVFRPVGHQYGEALEGRIDGRPVLLEAYHYDRVFKASRMTPAALFYYTREFYQRLTPRSYLRERLAALKPRFDGQFVVGLHVRSGNGEFARGGPYQDRVKTSIFDRDAFLERTYRACRDCLAAFPRGLDLDLGVLVATDSRAMQERLLGIPGAFAVRQGFPPAGAGHQFSDFSPEEYGEYSDVESVNETIIDMFLLASCRGLVCNESAFNRYAQHMTMFFNGNVKLLERYFEHPLKRAGRTVYHMIRSAT